MAIDNQDFTKQTKQNKTSFERRDGKTLKGCIVQVTFKNFGIDADAKDIRKELFRLIKEDLKGKWTELYAKDTENIQVEISAME